MAHEEYLRRNLIHAGSVGVVANLDAALRRLLEEKRHKKWLIELLGRTRERAALVPPEIARWRNAAPDAPRYVNPDDAARIVDAE